MKCEDIREMELALLELAPQAEEHLLSCAACRQYRQDLQTVMMKAPTFETNEHIDNKVLAFARKQHKRPVEVPVMTPKQKKAIPFAFLAAVAALMLITFTIATFLNQDDAPGVIAQNDGKVIVNVKKTDPLKTEQVITSVNDELTDDKVNYDDLWSDDELDIGLLSVENELIILDAELYLE